MSASRDGGVHNRASGQQGVVVQGRDFHGPITFNGITGPVAGPPARSAYKEQVRRIAPSHLLDREAELAELAEFCTSADSGAYLRWKGQAWTGKTALLSWFCLHAPPGVRVVPFFVTARLGAYNDRSAFVDVVLEQLAEIVGEPVPTSASATREAHLLDLLRRAAHACRHDGRRLVLVVDGLDEDRGVTTDPDAHSIAALLPHEPEAGMRVVVASRPSPPVPWDVWDGHPLLDGNIDRLLEPSAHAQVIRGQAERELKRQLSDGGLSRRVLALLTAAGGGLTVHDLATLTGAAVYEVEDTLRSLHGRTFSTRPSAFASGGAPDVYLLAHEALQDLAARLLGPAELAARRQELHDWADSHHAAGWPEDTPEYLLRGYFQLLATTADLPRMTRYATDEARQDRMFAAFGSDGSALAEIRLAQDTIVAQGGHPLPDMLRLTMHRDAVERRSHKVPYALPATWVALGRVAQGEALARDSGDERALLEVAREHVARGDRKRAAAITAEIDPAPIDTFLAEDVVRMWLCLDDVPRAEAVSRATEKPYHAQQGLLAVIDYLASRGRPEQAQALVGDLGGNDAEAQGISVLVGALARTGEHEHAQRLARAVADPYARALSLIRVAGAASMSTARRGTADGLLQEAESALRERGKTQAADGLSHPRTSHEDGPAESPCPRPGPIRVYDPAQGRALAVGFARAHDFDRALQVGGYLGWPEKPLVSLAVCEGLINTGQFERAESLANSMDEELDAGILAEIAGAFTRAGQTQRAHTIDDRMTTSPDHDAVRRAIGENLLARGEHAQAVEVARSLSTPYARESLMVEVARSLASAGDHPQARALLAQTASLSRTLPPLLESIAQQADLAEILAHAEHREMARHLLRDAERHIPTAAATSPHDMAVASCAVARALAASGLFDRAMAVNDAVVDAAAQLGSHALAHQLGSICLSLVRRLVDAGNFERATEITRALPHTSVDTGPFEHATEIARTLPHHWFNDVIAQASGILAQAREYRRAVELALTLPEPNARDTTVLLVAERLAYDGLRLEAMDVLRIITQAQPQAREDSVPRLAAFARARHALGELAEAKRLLDRAERLMTDDHLNDVLPAMVALRRHERAEDLVRGIPRDYRWGTTVTTLIDALCRAGAHHRAETFAQDITMPAHTGSAHTATRLFVGLALTRTPDQAAKLTALALREGSWLPALPAVLHATPAALAAVCERIPLVAEAAAAAAANA
ncbi:hypothetical protein ACIBL6_16040 [Streptomyces sp. NPDC050400]|uniref:hypothetical protein n=1 Tax=Streptomyces sp. NPDC050400 TaxID=3365610 RepID=UPI003791F7E1